MCGIIGMVSTESFSVKNELLRKLKRLEYRGYDSVGFATSSGVVQKDTGFIDQFSKKVSDSKERIAIAHTRWATHGGITRTNAHPHLSNNIYVVHNGIIQNYPELRQELETAGYRFVSETDSEVIAHYFDNALKTRDLKEAARSFIADAKGEFAALVIEKNGDELLALKRDSPLVLGVCPDRFVLASDIFAFSDVTNRAIFFEDDEFAIVNQNSFTFYNGQGSPVDKDIQTFHWEQPEKFSKDYKHFMIKEIYEQPAAATRLLLSLDTVQEDNIEEAAAVIENAKRLIFLGIGTAEHACELGARLFWDFGKESFAMSAGDFNERLVDEQTALVVISQSGETMDVIKVVKSLKKRYPGMNILALVNVPYSTLARLADVTIEVCAGPEICVASTKAFTNQVITCMYLAQAFGFDLDKNIDDRISRAIDKNEDAIRLLAERIYREKDIYVLGKGPTYPVAKEIALKIKEISYIHAEGMESSLLKHGTIALIDRGVPVISCVHNTNHALISAMQEVAARGAYTIVIADKKQGFRANRNFLVNARDEYEFALLSNILGQLLAYHLAFKLGRPIDKPRNLAKSVTVV